MQITLEQVELMQRYATLLERYMLAYRVDPSRKDDEGFVAWLTHSIARADVRHYANLVSVYRLTKEYTK